MPADFRVIPELNLVHVRYSGFARVDEGFEAFARYVRHPDFRPAQRQLVDLSAVTETEQDFPRLFALQAEKAATFLDADHPVMLVYYAPTEISLGMARLILRSWEGLEGVITRVTTEAAATCDILGLPESALMDLELREA